MRISWLDVEGSAEEIAAVPEISKALAGLTKRNFVAIEAPIGRSEAERALVLRERTLNDDIQGFIKGRAGNEHRAQITSRWVEEVLSWGNTEAALGTSSKTADGFNTYLMLYWTGPRDFGAFAYVFPGIPKAMLRLTRKDAEGFRHVVLREVKAGTGYEVTIPLNSEDAYREALELAKVALARVQSKREGE